MTDMGPHFNQFQEKALMWVIAFLLAVGFAASIILWVALVFLSFEEIRQELVTRRLSVFVGLPGACVVAFMLVFIFRHTSGPFEIEAPSLTIKGGTGPVILWLICFFAMATAIKMLW